MAKVITQETFDSIVRENMEEFDMDVEEAIADAVTQFESQGVNLLNIIRDPQLYSSGTGDGPAQHAVIQALDSLTAAISTDPPTQPAFTDSLSQLRQECDKDLARRCMAGKNGAFPLLLSACEKCESQLSELKDVLNTLVALCTGQPDLLNPAGLQLFMSYVTKFPEDTELISLALLLIRTTCIMHEQNRQDYVAAGLISLAVEALSNNREAAAVVKEACGILRVLTSDDDVRATFGKGHEHAKMIVTEENALRKLMNIAEDYQTDSNMLGELFLTLARLSVRNEFCAEIMSLGGVKLILETLSHNISDKNLVRQIMLFLKSISGNDDVKVAIVAAGGAELLVNAMDQHQQQARVAECGCAALASIILRNKDNCQRVMAAHGAEVIVKVMQLHAGDSKVQKQACMVVRNLVARNREFCPAFLENGAEPLIQTTLATHPSCKDEATAALRDLGCEVHLRVLWTGTGKSLATD